MQNLLNFIVKHNHWFLFLLLEGIGVMLIVQFNNYQGAKFFTSANTVAGGMFSAIADVNSYFGLKEENRGLMEQNRMLNEEIAALKAEIALHRDTAAVNTLQQAQGFYYKTATIINNSINSINNYITLDKGSNDGIVEEMGVFGSDGIVGIVYTVSPNYSIVVPLLNSKSNISCRIKGSNNFSPLQWRSGETKYSYMVDLPRYSKIEIGDTVVTSGFSSIFPGGMPVGRIVKVEDTADGMFYSARVELFTDFSAIGRVFLVGNNEREELKELEKTTIGNDK